MGDWAAEIAKSHIDASKSVGYKVQQQNPTPNTPAQQPAPNQVDQRRPRPTLPDDPYWKYAPVDPAKPPKKKKVYENEIARNVDLITQMRDTFGMTQSGLPALQENGDPWPLSAINDAMQARLDAREATPIQPSVGITESKMKLAEGAAAIAFPLETIGEGLGMMAARQIMPDKYADVIGGLAGGGAANLIKGGIVRAPLAAVRTKDAFGAAGLSGDAIIERLPSGGALRGPRLGTAFKGDLPVKESFVRPASETLDPRRVTGNITANVDAALERAAAGAGTALRPVGRTAGAGYGAVKTGARTVRNAVGEIVRAVPSTERMWTNPVPKPEDTPQVNRIKAQVYRLRAEMPVEAAGPDNQLYRVDGKPVVLYRGTGSEVDPSKLDDPDVLPFGEGVKHYTEDIDIARTYVGEGDLEAYNVVVNEYSIWDMDMPIQEGRFSEIYAEMLNDMFMVETGIPYEDANKHFDSLGELYETYSSRFNGYEETNSILKSNGVKVLRHSDPFEEVVVLDPTILRKVDVPDEPSIVRDRVGARVLKGMRIEDLPDEHKELLDETHAELSTRQMRGETLEPEDQRLFQILEDWIDEGGRDDFYDTTLGAEPSPGVIGAIDLDEKLAIVDPPTAAVPPTTPAPAARPVRSLEDVRNLDNEVLDLEFHVPVVRQITQRVGSDDPQQIASFISREVGIPEVIVVEAKTPALIDKAGGTGSGGAALTMDDGTPVVLLRPRSFFKTDAERIIKLRHEIQHHIDELKEGFQPSVRTPFDSSGNVRSGHLRDFDLFESDFPQKVLSGEIDAITGRPIPRTTPPIAPAARQVNVDDDYFNLQVRRHELAATYKTYRTRLKELDTQRKKSAGLSDELEAEYDLAKFEMNSMADDLEEAFHPTIHGKIRVKEQQDFGLTPTENASWQMHSSGPTDYPGDYVNYTVYDAEGLKPKQMLAVEQIARVEGETPTAHVSDWHTVNELDEILAVYDPRSASNTTPPSHLMETLLFIMDELDVRQLTGWRMTGVKPDHDWTVSYEFAQKLVDRAKRNMRPLTQGRPVDPREVEKLDNEILEVLKRIFPPIETRAAAWDTRHAGKPNVSFASPHEYAPVMKAVSRDNWARRLANKANVTMFGQTWNPIAALNPAALANTPAAVIVRARNWIMENEIPTLTNRIMSRVNQYGNAETLFGKTAESGELLEGEFKGLFLYDILTRYPRYKDLMNVKQKAWANTMHHIEQAKELYLRQNGVKINLLNYDDGGRHVGRRVYGLVDSDTGEVIIADVSGSGKPGAKTSSEKERIFATVKEATDAGYRYLPPDEALEFNVKAAYRRVADKKFAEEVFKATESRTTAISPELLLEKVTAAHRFKYLKDAILIARRAKRGEKLHGATINKIIKGDVVLGELFDRSMSIKLPDFERMIARMSEEQFKLSGITKEDFRRVLSEIRLQRSKGPSGPVAPLTKQTLAAQSASLSTVPTGAGDVTPGELTATLTQLTKDNRKTSKMLTKIYQQAKQIKDQDRIDALDNFIAEVELVMPSSARRHRTAQEAAQIAGRKARRAKVGKESLIKAPAFAGKIFVGRDSMEAAKIIEDSLTPQFNSFLSKVNKVNSVSRYFMLAGDVSVASIQLLFLAGANPRVYGKAIAAIPKSITDPQFQARYLDRPENQAIIAKYQNLIISRGGGTEFTEALAKGGLLRAKPVAMFGNVLTPAQRGFEGAMDVAGIELLKSLDHLATTTQKQMDLAQFVNEIRGMTSSAGIGVSAGLRQFETAALLAPRYNRAIAALMFDVTQGGLRGKLAREHMARGILAIMAIGTVISYAMGESEKDIIDHFDPRSGKFFTWRVAGQNIGPGTKVRSVIKLIGNTWNDPSALGDTSIGWGEAEYIKNPLIRFGRGNMSPVGSTLWDVFTGKDYLGDPTRDNPLSASITLGSNFLPIWVESTLFDNGTIFTNPDIKGRLFRAAADFSGLRAYPRNAFYESSIEWKDDLKLYDDVETTAAFKKRHEGELRPPAQTETRISFRRSNPEIDAKLFILGDVTSLKSGAAKAFVTRLMIANRDILKDAEPKQMEIFEKVLGLPLLNRIRNSEPLEASRNIPAAGSTDARSDWQRVSSRLDSGLIKALQTVWSGSSIDQPTENRLRRVFAQEPLGQKNFDVWLKQTLRQAQQNDAATVK